MSQRPPFLDNLYNVKRQRILNCFLQGFRIVLITGAVAIIIIPFIKIGTQDTINRARQHVSKPSKVKMDNIQNKTVKYRLQNQR